MINIEEITTEVALRRVIKPYPKLLDKRIQTKLDKYSLEFIQLARAGVVYVGGSRFGFDILDLQNPDCFALKSDKHFVIRINKEVQQTNAASLQCSLYFLIPGVGHGLRVNGRMTGNQEPDLFEVEIRSLYFQCARAAVRSGLWHSDKALPFERGDFQRDSFEQGNFERDNKVNDEVVEENLTAQHIQFIEASPYVLLGTQDNKGETELSPRGDPNCVAKVLEQGQILIPERPGNKVAISLRNILATQLVGLSFFIPNSEFFLTVTGRAKIISAPELLESFGVNNKVPKLGLLIEVDSVCLSRSSLLASSDFWAADSFPDTSSLTSFPKALAAHMNGDGWLGKVSAPVVGAVVKKDLNALY